MRQFVNTNSVSGLSVQSYALETVLSMDPNDVRSIVALLTAKPIRRRYSLSVNAGWRCMYAEPKNLSFTQVKQAIGSILVKAGR